MVSWVDFAAAKHLQTMTLSPINVCHLVVKAGTDWSYTFSVSLLCLCCCCSVNEFLTITYLVELQLNCPPSAPCLWLNTILKFRNSLNCNLQWQIQGRQYNQLQDHKSKSWSKNCKCTDSKVLCTLKQKYMFHTLFIELFLKEVENPDSRTSTKTSAS